MGTWWSVFLYVFWIFAFVAFLMVLFTVAGLWILAQPIASGM